MIETLGTVLGWVALTALLSLLVVGVAALVLWAVLRWHSAGAVCVACEGSRECDECDGVGGFGMAGCRACDGSGVCQRCAVHTVST